MQGSRYIVWVGLAVCFDQITKYLARQFLPTSNVVHWIDNILMFRCVFNPGAAYGIFPGQTLWLLFASVGIILGIILLGHIMVASRWGEYGLVWIVAGAIGNFLDRLFWGVVTDFINVANIFPWFNIADILINIGVICMLIDMRIDYVSSHRSSDYRSKTY